MRLNESSISTVLGAVVVVVVGILIYNYFTSVNKVAQVNPEKIEEGVQLVEESGEMVPQNLPLTHKVAEGEDLWKISQKYYESGYNWVDVARENKLTNANVITEGQELVIPRVGVKAVVKTEITTQAAVQESTQEYTVVKGDSLWKISVKVYADGYQWTKIWEANKAKISNPNVIETGQVLVLPR